MLPVCPDSLILFVIIVPIVDSLLNASLGLASLIVGGGTLLKADDCIKSLSMTL